MKVLKDIMVEMPDGVRLATDVFLPGDGKGKYPIIHVRCPYVKENVEKEIGAEIPAAEKQFNIEKYIENGYGFAIQDCRGTGKSEGLYKPWLGDAEDGYQFVEWIAQQKWCSGKIGAIGPSNFGAVQLLTASMRPPHLTCIVPVGTSRSLPFFENGILNLAGTSIWYIQQAFNSAVRSGMDKERFGRMKEKLDKIMANMEEQYNWLPLREIPLANVEEVDMELFFHEFLEYLDQPAHWAHINNPVNILNINVPVLLVTNWYDHLAKNTFELYKILKNYGTPTVQKNLRLYVGPWRRYPGVEGTSEGLWDNGRTLFDVTLGWFDYWLKGKENGFMESPPVFLHTMGKVNWKFCDSWPLPNTSYVKYYFASEKGANSVHGDGRLTEIKPETGFDSFIYDPMNPVPTRCGIVINPKDSLRQNQIDVEVRGDVLVYSTEQLSEDIEVIGPVKAHIWASTSAVDTDFTCKLVDVLPNGEPYNVIEGIVRARYRNGVENCELLIPGAIYEYEINLGATGIVFRKGHRIRVEIASSNFPKYDRNMNTGNKTGTDTKGITAYQRIYHDEKHPSHILLPVIK